MNTGWAMAILAGAVAAAALAWGVMQYRQVGRLEAEMATLERNYQLGQDQLVADLQDLEWQLETKRDRLRQSEDALAWVQERLEDRSVASTIEGFLAEPDLRTLHPPDLSDTGVSERELYQSATDALASPQMIRLTAENRVSGRYDSFFEKAGLRGEKRRAAEDILVSRYVERTAAAQQAYGETIDRDTLRRRIRSFREELREELRTVLDPDELALWEEHEATALQRRLDQMLDHMFDDMASELSTEGRATARRVFIEEYERIGLDPWMMMLFDAKQGTDAILAANDRATDRLADKLDLRAHMMIQMLVRQMDLLFSQQLRMMQGSE